MDKMSYYFDINCSLIIDKNGLPPLKVQATGIKCFHFTVAITNGTKTRQQKMGFLPFASGHWGCLNTYCRLLQVYYPPGIPWFQKTNNE